MDEKFTLGFLVPETVFVILCDYEIGNSCLKEGSGKAAKAEMMIFRRKLEAVNVKKSNYFQE